VVWDSYRGVSQVRQQRPHAALQEVQRVPSKRAAERNADVLQAEVLASERAQHLAAESARQAAAAEEERAHAAASARAASALAEELAEQEARDIQAVNERLRAKEFVEETLRRRAEVLQAEDVAAEEAHLRHMRLQVEAARRLAAEARAEAQERSVFEERATEQGQAEALEVGAQQATKLRWQALSEALEVRSQQVGLEHVESQAQAERLRAQEMQDAETARRIAGVAEETARSFAAEASSRIAQQAQAEEQTASAVRLRAQAQEEIAAREDRASRLLKQGIVEVDLDTSDDEVVEDTLEKSAKVRQLEAAHTQTSDTFQKTGSFAKDETAQIFHETVRKGPGIVHLGPTCILELFGACCM